MQEAGAFQDHGQQLGTVFISPVSWTCSGTCTADTGLTQLAEEEEVKTVTETERLGCFICFQNSEKTDEPKELIHGP